MQNEQIDLYAYFHVERKNAEGGRLTTYVREPLTEIKPKVRPAMLVLPGGGYWFCSEREAEPVALRFLAAGYSAFVLDYTVKTAFPVPLIEACMAVSYLRENAEKYGIDPHHIAAVGFSAGGHLTGMLATMYGVPEVTEAYRSACSPRPDAVVMSYPVVTMQDGLTHEGTRSIISDGGAIPYEKLSLENRVTESSAPAWIWHTSEDNCVPVENSMLLASAYRRAHVPFSLHIFEKGWHGLSLCDWEVNNQTEGEVALTPVGKWVDLALDWLTDRGFTVRVLSREQL